MENEMFRVISCGTSLMCIPYFYSHVRVVGSGFPLSFQYCSRGRCYTCDPNQYNLIRQLQIHRIYVVGTYVYMERVDKVTVG